MVTLTKAEERIMQILWDLKRGFIKDIQENFPDPQPPYNTISTIVRVLVKKENNYFSNSLKEVVNFFSEKKDLDVEELDEAMRMLEDLKKKRDQ